MQGSVRKRGKTWSYRIDIGKIDGKRKQKEKGGFRSKKEAQHALNIALNELNYAGKIFENKKITLQELYDNFINNEAPMTRKFSTIKRYKSLYANHLDTFGFKYLTSITTEELQIFLSSKTKKLSNEYVRSLYNFLSLLFKYAERMEYLKDNPMHKVVPPKNKNTKDIKVYTLEELNLLNTRLSTTNLQPAFQTGINTGVRAGECYALRWSDVDFDNNSIVINKQLQYYNKRWCFTTLKTQNSYRAIKISNSFKQYLLNLKKQQELSKQFYEASYKINVIIDARSNTNKAVKVDDFINVKPNGQMLTPYSNKVISRIASECGINFKYHNLRHTHATLLLEKGVNPRYIQQRLGHSKLEFTLRLYTHVTYNMDTKVSEILDSIHLCPQK